MRPRTPAVTFLCKQADCRQRVELLCDSTTRNSFYADNQAESNQRNYRPVPSFTSNLSSTIGRQTHYIFVIPHLMRYLIHRSNSACLVVVSLIFDCSLRQRSDYFIFVRKAHCKELNDFSS